jgi:hypothetical protein
MILLLGLAGYSGALHSLIMFELVLETCSGTGFHGYHGNLVVMGMKLTVISGG